MKLGAENLGFCIKLFNHVVLLTQATFNASAGYIYASTGYMPVYTVFLLILHFTSYSSIYKVLPWDG